jgi:hypothetical protein
LPTKKALGTPLTGVPFLAVPHLLYSKLLARPLEKQDVDDFVIFRFYYKIIITDIRLTSNQLRKIFLQRAIKFPAHNPLSIHLHAITLFIAHLQFLVGIPARKLF